MYSELKVIEIESLEGVIPLEKPHLSTPMMDYWNQDYLAQNDVNNSKQSVHTKEQIVEQLCSFTLVK